MKLLSYEAFLTLHDKFYVIFLTAVLISPLSCYSQFVYFFIFYYAIVTLLQSVIYLIHSAHTLLHLSSGMCPM